MHSMSRWIDSFIPRGSATKVEFYGSLVDLYHQL